jgi:hypothetical protein
VLSVVRNRRKAESVTIANRLLNLDPVLFAVTLALGGAGRVQKDSSVYKVLSFLASGGLMKRSLLACWHCRCGGEEERDQLSLFRAERAENAARQDLSLTGSSCYLPYVDLPKKSARLHRSLLASAGAW